MKQNGRTDSMSSAYLDHIFILKPSPQKNKSVNSQWATNETHSNVEFLLPPGKIMAPTLVIKARKIPAFIFSNFLLGVSLLILLSIYSAILI